MNDEPIRFRAKPPSTASSEPRFDPVAIILSDLAELDKDARSIVLRGRDRFLSDDGRLERHAADGILVKVQELCERLPDSFKAGHPGVPWSEIRGIRNRIGHDYRATDPRIVWTTISESIPALISTLS